MWNTLNCLVVERCWTNKPSQRALTTLKSPHWLSFSKSFNLHWVLFFCFPLKFKSLQTENGFRILLSISWATRIHLYRPRRILKTCSHPVSPHEARQREEERAACLTVWRLGGAAGRWSSADGGRCWTSLDVSALGLMCLLCVSLCLFLYRSFSITPLNTDGSET